MNRALPPGLGVLSLFGFAVTAAATRSGAQPPAVPFVGWLLLGAGDLATMTRELLDRAEPDIRRRPRVRVG